MQIVIDIPEEDYNFVTKQVADGITNPWKICIANGTPLPKGHGRLIDADAIDTKWSDPAVSKTLDDAPTILEADID